MFQFNSSRIFDDSNCLADESAETYSVVGFLGVGPGWRALKAPVSKCRCSSWLSLASSDQTSGDKPLVFWAGFATSFCKSNLQETHSPFCNINDKNWNKPCIQGSVLNQSRFFWMERCVFCCHYLILERLGNLCASSQKPEGWELDRQQPMAGHG